MTTEPRPKGAPTPSPSGYRWRKAHGLLTWKDQARRWRFARATPAGCLCPTPDTPALPSRWGRSA